MVRQPHSDPADLATPPMQPAAVPWTDPARAAAFDRWLQALAPQHGLHPASVRLASADASFRRYLRVDCAGGGSLIIMDAPPTQENCEPFVRIAALMAGAGLRVPRVLEWDAAEGFLLLTDLGSRTMMDVIDREQPEANRPLYVAALDALLAWQQAQQVVWGPHQTPTSAWP